MSDPYERAVEWTPAMGWCPEGHRLSQPDSDYWPHCFICAPSPVPQVEGN